MTIPVAERILRTVLTRDVPLADEQVSFQPPDQAWRTRVSEVIIAGQHVSALDVFLVEVLENERLRSNEHVRTITNGAVTARPAPFRVDCHYLVSAWAPADDSAAFKATEEEHALLALALRALVRNVPLNPGRTLSDNDLKAVPAELHDADLPTRIAPGESFAKLAEFWSGMGEDIRWHPVVEVVVTVPVLYEAAAPGGIVDTIITELGRRAGSTSLEGSETLVTVGGVVVTTAGAPIPFARVGIQTPTGEALDRTTAGPEGRFRFAGLTPGRYDLTWSANGFTPPAAPTTVDVPSAGGRYELQLT